MLEGQTLRPLQGFCNAVVFIGMNPIVWYRARQEMFGVASGLFIVSALILPQPWGFHAHRVEFLGGLLKYSLVSLAKLGWRKIFPYKR